jgi:Cd2+/Zn2+-exporting ATPase
MLASSATSSDRWTAALATFLKEHREVGMLRIQPSSRRVEMATLGEIDEALLRAQLLETIQSISSSAAADATADLRGLLVEKHRKRLTVSRPTCPTAPRFFKWTVVDWPEPQAQQADGETGEEWRELAVLAAACAVLGISGWITATFTNAPPWVAISFYVGAMLAGGWDALGDVRKKLPKGELDIHFLMLAVAVGASAIGAWAEGALLLFLFSFAAAMEHFALHRTRREINGLFAAAPKTATRVASDGSETEVPIEEIRVGEHLRVRPGNQFPVDGDVIEGKTAADESNLTGEAIPVAKQIGDPVFGGTINLWGAVTTSVTRPASSSALQKVIQLIREAQHMKAPSQRFTDRFGTGYTIGVLILTAALFLGWWLLFDIPPFTNTEQGFSAFYRAMTFLVVASPCALVLSIPSAILAAIAWGARRGILFRGGAAIEGLAEIRTVALDKTGTLTTGEMEVVGIETFPAGREQEAAQLAVSLEAHGSHPIGRAIRHYGKTKGIEPVPVEDFEALSGKGVRGQAAGMQCILGRRELLNDGPLASWIRDVPEPPPECVENWLIREDLIARILLRDQIRLQSAAILKELHQEGIQTIMLTGDRSGAAEAVGATIGIQQIRAGLSPEDKVMAIRGLSSSSHRVAMVGDGVNDAPCLAAADVAVAMGARGSDAALEQADIVLMHDRIENFLAAFQLSRRARTIIRQNLAIALGTVVLMGLAAILGWIPLSIGVLAHEGSTVVVCLNSLRLLFGKPSFLLQSDDASPSIVA